jgi:hypothetical protein
MMSNHYGYSHDRIRISPITVEEQEYIEIVKTAMLEAIEAYENGEYYHKHLYGKTTTVYDRHPWMPWRKVGRSVPPPVWMDGHVEIYNTGEYVGDGKTDHFVIHFHFTTESILNEAITVLKSRNYASTEHGHYISDSVPRHWQRCGDQAFEPQK